MNSIEIDRELVSLGMAVVSHDDLVSRVESLNSDSIFFFFHFLLEGWGTFFFSYVKININEFVACEFSVINIFILLSFFRF